LNQIYLVTLKVVIAHYHSFAIITKLLSLKNRFVVDTNIYQH